MKKLIIAILVFINVCFIACQPKELAQTYDNPHWAFEPQTDYTVSMTATIQLPADLALFSTQDDQMVALVGDEIRGTAVLYSDSLFHFNILGYENEVNTVVFRYWNSRTMFMYESADYIPFKENAIIGTPDQPFIPSFITR